jgi:hypothetical protein
MYTIFLNSAIISVKHVSTRGHVRVKVTLRRVCVTIFAVEKQEVFTDSECAPVALVIQHAHHISRIILSSVVWPALRYFSTYHSQHDFRKKTLQYKMF